jgi:hypothetical protein
MQAAVLNHLVALVADAVLNDHHRNNPIVHDHDLDPDRHVVVVAQRLRVCSAAYMALGASLLIIVGDGDSDGDHNDHVLEGFLLWMVGPCSCSSPSPPPDFPRRLWWPPASHRLRSRSLRFQPFWL